MVKVEPGRIAIFLIPFAGFVFPFLVVGSHLVVSGTSMCACALELFEPAYEPWTLDCGDGAFGFGRSKPKFGVPLSTKPFSVETDGLILPPEAFQERPTVNGSLFGCARPLHVPGWLPWNVSPIFTLVGVTPCSVVPEQVPLSLPVTVDGWVFWFVSGGSILILPVISQVTVPVAVMVGFAAAPAGPDIATAPPSASMAAVDANRILRNMAPPVSGSLGATRMGARAECWLGSPGSTTTKAQLSRATRSGRYLDGVTAPEAVLLDAGGVFLLPEHDRILGALARAGCTPGADLLDRAHYRGASRFTTELDVEGDWAGSWHSYLEVYVDECAVADEDREEVHRHLDSEFADAALWLRVIPGCREGLRALSETGVRLGVVSNADGLIGERLRALEILQVGPGLGVEVDCVIDSGLVGVMKPDPRIFAVALEAMNVAPERAWYVGDMPAIDVVGARRAGLRPVLMDPFGFHHHADYDRVDSLADLAERIATSP